MATAAAAIPKMRITFVFIIISTVFISVCCGQEELLNYAIIEESPVGTFVGDVREDSKLRATASEEEFSQISYSILSTEEVFEGYFTVDSVNGSLYTTEKIDRESLSVCAFETTCNLSLSIVARAIVSSFYRTLNVQITIRDINDHAPAFPKDSTTIDISELATLGSSMSLVGAVDDDSGSFSLQRYYIMNEETLNLPFTTSYDRYVDGSSVVKLEITGDLDRERADAYTLIIIAEDGGNPKLTGTMTVNINIEDTNDNPPVFVQDTYHVTINETISIGTEIIKLSANDDDLGINGQVEYRLSRNQIGKIQEQFNLNETSGVLSVKEKFASGGQYRIIVEASDKGTQPLMSQSVVVVTVLDSDNNTPEIKINLFTESNIGTVSEYADIGTVVAHVRIIDTDTGVNGIIECLINSDDHVFKLQGYDVNEFKVTVAKGIDRESLDFIFVVINCHDKGSPPKTTFVEFTVQVIDENDHFPEFLQEIYFVDVSENNLLNVDLVQVSAIDDDIGKNGDVTYSVWAPGSYRFSMDPLSGIIKALSVFDRETDAKIIIYAYAKDNGAPKRTSTATIQINVLDENDNDPTFIEPMYVFYIPENADIGNSLGFVEASDIDEGDNALLGLHVDPALPFSIDATGVIRTTETLDREKTKIYSFLVTAFDHGVPSRNTSTNVVVHVTDVNDHAPTFIFPDTDNYTVELDAETESKQLVAKIKAFDIDDGVNGQLFYKIVNSNVTELFAIDDITGYLTLKRPLTDADREIYNIQLLVEDRGNPKLQTLSSINVFIVRRQTPAPTPDTKGENLLIAITLGSVTFVLVFTIALVICILRRRWFNSTKEPSDSEDQFCEKVKVSERRRVKFADFDQVSKGSTHKEDTPTGHEPMTTFSSDGNESRDSDMTSSTVDMETPILDKQKQIAKERVSPAVHRENLPGISETREMHHSTPRSDISQPRIDMSKPRYENQHQLQALQSHSVLLNSTIKPHTSMSTFAHDDNHSQTSGETVTSDSGRGGSESDIHSASLSQSHDSDMRAPSDIRYMKEPAHSTMMEPPPKPWLNLEDLRYHNCNKLPVAQQLHDDRKHRLQLRNLADRKRARPSNGHPPQQHRPFKTLSDRNLNRIRAAPHFSKQTTPFPPPPSDIDRSFMTYEDDDDDMSTTTSGSYTIDQEDVSLDFRSPIPKSPGLRGCLV